MNDDQTKVNHVTDAMRQDGVEAFERAGETPAEAQRDEAALEGVYNAGIESGAIPADDPEKADAEARAELAGDEA